MLGHWALGEEALGAYPVVSGAYVYPVDLNVALALSGAIKRGVAFVPLNNITVGQSATRKAGAKLAVSNGIVVAESATVKAGVKFTALNNVALALSATQKINWSYAESFLNSTLAINSLAKVGWKLAVVNGVTVAVPVTLKVGAKLPAANAWSIATDFDLNVGWKAPSTLQTLALGVSAGIGSEYSYEGLAGVEIAADSLYNQAYLRAQLTFELALQVDAEVSYRAAFWSPSVVTSGSWTKATAATNDWTEESAPDGSWSKEAAI